jgi:hypothetical protein
VVGRPVDLADCADLPGQANASTRCAVMLRGGSPWERAKRIVRAVVPEAYLPSRIIVRCLLAQSGGVVCNGPFRGMHYLDRAVGSACAPKVLGTYEKELTPIIENVIASSPSLIINIGAAEGYYSVEFARRLPQCRVISYESSLRGRELLQQLAILNAVESRITIRGACSGNAWLSDLLSNALVLSDCEGMEEVLFSHDAISRLTEARLFIEVHEVASLGVTKRLAERFQEGHDVRLIDAVPLSFRDVHRFWAAVFLKQSRLVDRYLRDSRRDGIQWLYAVPRSRIEGKPQG